MVRLPKENPDAVNVYIVVIDQLKPQGGAQPVPTLIMSVSENVMALSFGSGMTSRAKDKCVGGSMAFLINT